MFGQRGVTKKLNAAVKD